MGFGASIPDAFNPGGVAERLVIGSSTGGGPLIDLDPPFGANNGDATNAWTTE